MKRTVHLIVVVVLGIMMFGFGSRKPVQNENSRATKYTKYFTPQVVGGKITLEKSRLEKKPVYVNYNSGNIIIQMIAVIASDGTSRISLNTCQSCSPSPKAYFAEKRGKLVCQTCGNEFTYDDVGVTSSGCNPMNIECEENDSQIIVSVNMLNQYKHLFKNWQGTYQ